MSETAQETARELCARVGDKQRLMYRITPMSNSLLPADTMGKQLTALAEIFRSIGKQDGVNLKTMVASIKTEDDGTVAFELFIMPAVVETKE